MLKPKSVLLVAILFFVLVLIHITVTRHHHRRHEKDPLQEVHYQPRSLESNVHYVLEVDPLGWYPDRRGQTFHDKYETFKRHRVYA